MNQKRPREECPIKRAVIECAGIETAEQLHAALARELGFPEYYGGNLDALADCLGDITEETVLTLRDISLLRDRLGTPCDRLLEVLGRAAAENSRLMLLMTESAHGAAGKAVLQ